MNNNKTNTKSINPSVCSFGRNYHQRIPNRVNIALKFSLFLSFSNFINKTKHFQERNQHEYS